MTKPPVRLDDKNYSLDTGELRAEVLRLRAEGWQWWELRERFDLKKLGINTPREES